ncbi:sensor histidine kinase [Kineococcus gynurae]|uniref:histidine kinase n=1 Tax=Kineococcus gynurae TaxID=452979 RepID=A0ABV5LPV8_9ACTN
MHDTLRRRSWIERYGPRIRDVLLVVLGLAFAAAFTHDLLTQGGRVEFSTSAVRAPVVLSGVLAALSALALWWRRRYPVVLTVAGSAVGLLVGFDGVAVLALLTLAVRRRDRLLVLLSAVVFVTSVASGLRAPGVSWLVALLTSAAFVAIAVFLGAFVGARRDLVRSLRERAERAEAEQVLRAEQARLAERTRIAREMHDVLAHRISLVVLHAGGLEVRPDVGAEQVEASAATIRETARTALEDLRRVLGVLRTPGETGSAVGAAELLPQPTLVDVRRLVEGSREAGVDADFRTDVPLHADVPAELGRTVYRVVQEALTNVHKHAPSARTMVTVSTRTGTTGRSLLVSVVNERPTSRADDLPGTGSGLVGLTERVGIASGTLTSGLEPGGGFAVRAVLPWPCAEGADPDRAAWTPPDFRPGARLSTVHDTAAPAEGTPRATDDHRRNP